MGGVLHMDVHPRRLRGNQGPSAILKFFNQQVRAGVLFRQGKPDPEAKRGSIPLLRGGNIFSSGDNIPQTQHNEKPRL